MLSHLERTVCTGQPAQGPRLFCPPLRQEVRRWRTALHSTVGAAEKYAWEFKPGSGEGKNVRELEVAAIRRPLRRVRSNDEEKVEALMKSIQEVGLQEPIDVLEVDGKYYGFNGCHRYEAHSRLGLPTIKCRVRKATQSVLRMHMM